jgi:S-DNA-T family DNA segregation ATPase FtsK/SpoIIIE
VNASLWRWSAALRWATASEQADAPSRIRWHAFLHQAPDGPVVLPVVVEPGTTSARLVERSEVLRALYRCALVEVVPDTERGDRATVVLHRTGLPPSATYLAQEPAGVLPRSPFEPLPLGLDLGGDIVAVPLFHADSGGTTVLVGGVPGSGKTTALRALLAGLAPTPATLLVIDPTGGAEAMLWADRASVAVTSADPFATIDLLRDVLGLIERRGRLLGAGIERSALAPVVLCCDELAELAAAGTPKQQDEARGHLRRIVALGRKANVSCVLATQRTTATSIDVTTRSLAGWRVALAHPDDTHGSEALLGPGRRHAAELSKDHPGVAYLTNGGPPRLLRVLTVVDEQVGPLARSGAGRDLDDLAGWENAVLRELDSS